MSQTYRPDIDGLRALAILPVIFFHAGFGCTGGFVGVDVFFVISGFLITSLILKEIKEGKFSLIAFWERRVRRLLPAAVTVIFVTFVAGWFLYFPADFQMLGGSAVAQTVFQSNVFFWQQSGYFAPGSDTQPLLHTWSLAVEEQFYFVFPMLLVILAKRRSFSFSKAIAIIAIASFAANVWGTYTNPSAAFYLLPSRAWELMVGAFLASTPVRPLPNAWWNEAVALLGLGLILYATFFYSPGTPFPGLAAAIPCAGAALIVFSGTAAEPTLIRRALVLKPVVFIGLISYSLYLWHWPLLVFAKYSMKEVTPEFRAALLVLSFALSVVSWRWIGMPFRKRTICPRRPQVFAFAGCTVMTLLILGAGVYFGHGMPSRVPADALGYYNYKYDFLFRIEVSPQQAAAGQFAELGGQNTNKPIDVLLWGDSHAMAVAPVIHELCRKYSVRGVEATHSATAPILGDSNHDPRGLRGDSSAFSQSVVDFVHQKHIKAVILAADWADDSYGSPDSLAADLALTVQTLIDSGTKVYLLKDVPRPDFDVPRQAALTAMHHGDLEKLEIPSEKYHTRNDSHEFIFERLSKIGATVLDSPKCFMNANGCYDVVRNGKLLYFDKQHLTIAGSELLAPMLEPLFLTITKSQANS